MANISVALDDAAAARLLGKLAEYLRQFPDALEKNKIVALNRVSTSLNKEAVSILTGRYTAKRGDIQRKIVATKASSSKPFIMLRGEGRPINLEKWLGKKTAVVSLSTRRKYFGWRVSILKGSPFKLVTGGFRGISSKNSLPFIFRRQGQGRYPLEVLYGPTMIGFLNRPENVTHLQGLAHTRLELEMRRDAEYRLKKLGVL